VTEYRIEDLPPNIARKIIVNPDTGCWEWQGYRTPKGYGRVARRVSGGKVRVLGVHRVVYEMLVGSIPEDRPHLDHVKALGCASKACCWPGHLEPVTLGENSLRGDTLNARNAAKTHCIRGHEFDLINTYFDRNGHRECRACDREKDRRRRSRKAA
jgi:hypothetical protein